MSRASDSKASRARKPQAGKKSKKKRTPPTVGEVIRKRRARIDQSRTIRAFLFKLIVIGALGYGVFTYVFGIAAMDGEQMYPRIRDGDLMLYYRLEDDCAIGDVVTFSRGDTRYTARVIAKGGDTVNIDETGLLQVNGNVQSEEIFYQTKIIEDADVRFPLTVGEGELFLLCDMRTQATDSRVYGVVKWEDIDGKVITILRRRGI